MPTFNDLTSFDWVILCIFLLFCIRGLWIGSMRQLAVFFALVGGYLAAGQYTAAILPRTGQFVDNPKLIFWASYGIIFLFTVTVFTLIGKFLHRFMQITLLGWLDRLLGLVIGGLKAAVVASLLYMVLASTLSTTNTLLRTSYISPYLQLGAGTLRSWINDPLLQKHFTQREPAIRPELIPGREKEQTLNNKPPGQ